MFPGLAVAEVLRAQGHSVLLFVSEKEVDRRALSAYPDLPTEKLPSIGLPSIFSLAIFSFLKKMRASLKRCGKIYDSDRPDAVLGMGGFTSIAPLIAARRRGIPAFLHESNAIPGKANRLAAKFCGTVLLGFTDCAQYFPSGKTRLTGTPIRRELSDGRTSPGEARRQLGLSEDCATLLVMGGSQGASGINSLMRQAAPHLEKDTLQILHLAGERDVESLRLAYEAAGLVALVLPFSDRMQDLYPAADLALSRSGAASLGELSWYGLPSILIPYPHAAEDHQRLNAEIFVRAGAALLLAEIDAGGSALADQLGTLLANRNVLHAMSTAARDLAPQNAAERVAVVLTGEEK